MNRKLTYSISCAQLERLAQLISVLDDGAVHLHARIAAASEAHGIVIDVLGPDENLVYPHEDTAPVAPVEIPAFLRKDAPRRAAEVLS